MLRAVSHVPAKTTGPAPSDSVVLAHDERRLRRKLLQTASGSDLMVDLPQTVTLDDGGSLVLDDGRHVGVRAAEEDVYHITASSPGHLLRLAWHIGNRHTPAELLPGHISIKRDHVLKSMLEGLGAKVEEHRAPFSPEHGAYHGHGHGTAEPHAAAHALLYRR